nr:GATA zinc finger domain-containing protein 14-like [Leptinotarsa decemlineata]
MNMEEELSKDCPETENIYSDIIEFDLGTEVEKLKEENSRLEDHIDSLQQDVEKLVEAVKWLKTLQDNLAENISSLFLTAQTELARKDRIIEDLRRKLDDIIFRRDVRKRKPELYSSPDHLSKRARFDPPINVADDRKTIHENNSHDYRGHNKNNFEKDNIDHFNIEERSNVVDEWNDRDGKHENDSTNSRAKSYGQNNTRMKNGNMYDRKEDRYIHSRKEDSRRGDRYSNHYRRTHDRKEFQRTESCQLPRKRNEIVEKETHTSDEEHNVQNLFLL